MSDWHLPRKIYTRSEDAPSIWARILARENALAAWDKVRRNQGAPGVDGVSIRDLAPCFEQEWAVVDTALRRGVWQPHPVRRVSVPKPGGGQRNLGIPTVMDRVVHQTVAQVLSPRWECRFSPHSFAYRQGRGVREALADLASQTPSQKNPMAWHLDIESFFDTVPHGQAVRAVRRVVDEPEPLCLVRDILAAGVFDGNRVSATPAGIPQGSPLSPLLANGVLHDFDLWLAAQQLPFVRYADDIVIILPAGNLPAQWQPAVEERLDRLGLRLNYAKTTYGSPGQLAFLGFGFFQDDRGLWRRRISAAAWEALDQELQRRSGIAWQFTGTDEGGPDDYFSGWLAHYGITECQEDQRRLTELAARHRRGALDSEPVRVRMPYGGGARTAATPRQQQPGWAGTFRLWALRALSRRWLRLGLDWGRGARAIRVSLGPFTFRFRL